MIYKFSRPDRFGKDREYKGYTPKKICKYSMPDLKECYNDKEDPEFCKNCCRNPHRFEGKVATRGQKIFLSKVGYTEEQLKDIDYLTALRMIQEYKGKN